MRTIDVKVVVWKEGRHYVSQCLNFDVASFGKTEAAALANLKEAVALLLEDDRRKKPANVVRPSVVSMRLSYA